MSTDSLYELLDLSFGTPDVGAVNFSALYTLLHAILGHMKTERVKTNVTSKEVDNDDARPTQSKASLPEPSSPHGVLEEQLRALPTDMGNENASTDMGNENAFTDMGNENAPTDMGNENASTVMGNENASTVMGNENASTVMGNENASTVMGNENASTDKGNEKASTNMGNANASTDMGNENASSKCMDLIQDLQKEVQALKESRDDLRQEVDALNAQLSQNELKDKMAQYPVPEELSKCVMLEEMQAEFNSERQKIQEGLQDTVSAAKDTVPVLPLNLGSPIEEDRAGTGGTPGVDLSPPQQSLSDEADEVGRLRDRHESLETRVGQLEANNADQTQIQHLQDLLTAMGERQIPDHVLEQLNHLRTLVDSLLEDKEKCVDLIQDLQKEVQVLRQEVDALNGQLSQVSEGESVLMSSDTCGQSDQDTDTSQIAQLTLQTSDSDIRTAVLKLDEKVQVLMREKSNREEERSSQYRHIQEQLNSLRVLIEDHVQSSGHDQDESSHQDQSSGKDQDQSSGQGEAQQQKEDHDLNQEDSQSPKSDYKPPKDKITHIKNQELWDRIKNIDVASDVKGVLLELQADIERLHGTSRRLMEEHSEKQLHIDRLDKLVKELDEKKVDKQALESKVNRMQFDNMVQELLGKISGQEKDWNKLIEKISTEMDCKLNRIELDPLKKQLDDCWRNINKNLQTQSLPEQDNAAGLRKQLVAQFWCLFCNRSVDMKTPGPLMPTLPLAPVLTSHTSYCRRQKDQEPSQSSISRSSGGKHTLTYSRCPNPHIQKITHLIQSDEESQPMSSGLHTQAEEANIMGLNGQVYKGGMNSRAEKLSETRLPPISLPKGNRRSPKGPVDAGRGSDETQCS